jgi:hypothetical protein
MVYLDSNMVASCISHIMWFSKHDCNQTGQCSGGGIHLLVLHVMQYEAAELK